MTERQNVPADGGNAGTLEEAQQGHAAAPSSFESLPEPSLVGSDSAAASLERLTSATASRQASEVTEIGPGLYAHTGSAPYASDPEGPDETRGAQEVEVLVGPPSRERDLHSASLVTAARSPSRMRPAAPQEPAPALVRGAGRSPPALRGSGDQGSSSRRSGPSPSDDGSPSSVREAVARIERKLDAMAGVLPRVASVETTLDTVQVQQSNLASAVGALTERVTQLEHDWEAHAGYASRGEWAEEAEADTDGATVSDPTLEEQLGHGGNLRLKLSGQNPGVVVANAMFFL